MSPTLAVGIVEPPLGRTASTAERSNAGCHPTSRAKTCWDRVNPNQLRRLRPMDAILRMGDVDPALPGLRVWAEFLVGDDAETMT